MDIIEIGDFKHDEVKLKGRTFKNKLFKFEGTASGVFKESVFIKCSFENIAGFFLGFEDCVFKECFISNVNFSHTVFNWKNNTFEKCNIRHTNFDEGDMSNVTFNETEFTNVSFAGMYPLTDIQFQKCNFSFSNFSTVAHNSTREYTSTNLSILFYECSFSFTHFEYSDLKNAVFKNCDLSDATLLNCTISKYTFQTTKAFENKNPESVAAKFDMQTISNALAINREYLRKYFNIKDNNLFQIAKTFKQSSPFHSVFISYSFKDSVVAKYIYKYLHKNKVPCFLWENDAPGGKFMKHIMASEIKKRNKIIFIASENSLKSTACQFELSEGRMKQAINWDEVFVPVFLDSYLFDVQEYQIRPIEKAAEYWKNISELKNINCINATNIYISGQRGQILSEILQALYKSK